MDQILPITRKSKQFHYCFQDQCVAADNQYYAYGTFCFLFKAVTRANYASSRATNQFLLLVCEAGDESKVVFILLVQ